MTRAGGRVRCKSRVYDVREPLLRSVPAGTVGEVQRHVRHMWEGQILGHYAIVAFGLCVAHINVNALEKA